ncbi:endolytic transglycosylase MltG [Paenibacillus donghaensis]|uniref:Uncharacterized protein n=1 Tax=Paenibacillus donghaensis TaxID=414771 RepID=A0A2Z2KGA4_9BACL|nr:endolytic transglycosylase MltG [Paenibacillus donghaensis]ASA22233.1 hypothetical protein B9T62_16445 [Paenibacillus donghaensis]
MMKNRSFLFGLGTGLILGALLLQLMISGGAAPLSREQLAQEAAKLGLTVSEAGASPSPSPEDSVATPQPVDAAAEASPPPAAPSAPAEAASPSPAASPGTAADPQAASTPVAPSAAAAAEAKPPAVSPAPSAAAPATPAASGVISVRIPSGANLSKTANLLSAAGVVKDREQFLAAANKRKINKVIQYGTYSFKEDESFDSIIDQLITVK